MKKIRLFEWGGGSAFFHQWGRLKRRERNLYLFIYLGWLLHVIFWILWITLIVPNPVALTVPLMFSLGAAGFLRDFLWPIFNTILLAVSTWLIFYAYHRDILAAWLLLGAVIMVQMIILTITISLIMVAV